ncbi:MAG: sigma-70 family RNA polymerase sigma factor [Acidimicrobiia bacterium]|nr:sigma-70 family RNA polymerase sigma factor [Acidimicrobiia bacterium]
MSLGAPVGVGPFEAERPRLLGIAYRVVGTFADAEDVVQEVWLRWQAADQAAIERPAAWLTTVTSRAALDRLRAQQRRREEYVGPWLPEPIRVDAPGPEEAAELAESLTLGFLAVLERLEPVERVVFLLADVFGEPFAGIAIAVDRSEVACRQIASRARKRVRDERRARPSPHDQDIVAELVAAVGAGDVDRTIGLLDPDVVLTSDGGPRHRAARNPVVTAPRVARFLVNLVRRTPVGTEVHQALVNGHAAIVIGSLHEPRFAVVFETRPGAVTAIDIVVNPDKLGHLAEPVRHV